MTKDHRRKFAKPGDYAKWGVELGFQTAELVSKMPAVAIGAREAKIAEDRRTANEFIAAEIASGASRDEGALYLQGFESGLQEKLKAIAAGGQCRVTIKTAEGEVEIIG